MLTLFGAIAVDSFEVNARVVKDGKLGQYWSEAGVRNGAQSGGRIGAEHRQGEHQPA